jgi:hypothetical protein
MAKPPDGIPRPVLADALANTRMRVVTTNISTFDDAVHVLNRNGAAIYVRNEQDLEIVTGVLNDHTCAELTALAVSIGYDTKRSPADGVDL